jgi:hypothetical protein
MVGFQQASAAQGLLGKFVAGGQGFIQGVTAGLANPITTGKDILGIGDAAAVTNIAGEATTGAELLAEPGVSDTMAQIDMVGNEAAAAASTPVSGINDTMSQIDLMGNQGAGGIVDAATAGAPGGNPSIADGFRDLYMKDVHPDPMAGVPGGNDALNAALKTPAPPGAPPETGFMAGLKEASRNPMMQLTAARMMSGWAEGKAREEEIKMFRKDERQRRDSFDGFSSQNTSIPRLQDLGRKRQDVNSSRDIINAKYGRG